MFSVLYEVHFYMLYFICTDLKEVQMEECKEGSEIFRASYLELIIFLSCCVWSRKRKQEILGTR